MQLIDLIKEGNRLYKKIEPLKNTISAPFYEYRMETFEDYSDLKKWKESILQWLKHREMTDAYEDIERIPISSDFIVQYGINKDGVKKIIDLLTDTQENNSIPL